MDMPCCWTVERRSGRYERRVVVVCCCGLIRGGGKGDTVYKVNYLQTFSAQTFIFSSIDGFAFSIRRIPSLCWYSNSRIVVVILQNH